MILSLLIQFYLCSLLTWVKVKSAHPYQQLPPHPERKVDHDGGNLIWVLLNKRNMLLELFQTIRLVGGWLKAFLAILWPKPEAAHFCSPVGVFQSALSTCASSDDLTGAALIPASPDAWTPYPLYTTELTPGLPHAAFPYPAAAAAAAALHAQVRDQPVCVPYLHFFFPDFGRGRL